MNTQTISNDLINDYPNRYYFVRGYIDNAGYLKGKLEKDEKGNPCYVEHAGNYAVQQGCKFALIDLSECYNSLTPDMLHDVKLTGDLSGIVGSIDGYLSGVKKGRVLLSLDDFTQRFVNGFVRLLGFTEARARFNLICTISRDINEQEQQVFTVPSGAVVEGIDKNGKPYKDIITKGYGVTSHVKQIKVNQCKSSHVAANVFSELPNHLMPNDVIQELYQGLEKSLMFCNMKGHFKAKQQAYIRVNKGVPGV